jgi:hypothetical protein
MDFQDFPKMARLSRECIITEKIDGTNAQVFIAPGYPNSPGCITSWFDDETGTDMVMYAGSRTRWITPEEDNYGFAAWVKANAYDLKSLGVGRHFGEWWGAGIQRRYGLNEKRFSLFNVTRWKEEHPGCCHVVPELFRGTFSTERAEFALSCLASSGSWASPGFERPEGIVVYHVAAGIGFKKTVEKDEMSKQQAAREAA